MFWCLGFFRNILFNKFKENKLENEKDKIFSQINGVKETHLGQTCAESHFFQEKSSQVIQKSSHDLTFFKIPKKSKS